MSKAGAASPKGGKKKNSKGSAVVSKSSASSPFGNQNQVLSRYLSDSIGSCHDLCKYGRKPSVDEEGSSLTIKSFIAEKRRIKKKTIITFDGDADGGKCILAKKEKNQIAPNSKERLSEENENHVPAASSSKRTKVVRRNTPPPSSSPSSSARIRTKGLLAAEKSRSLSSGRLKSKLASGFKSLFVVDPLKKDKARNPSSFSRTLPSRKPKKIKSIKPSSAAKKTKKVAVDLKSEDDVKEKAVYFTEDNNEKDRIGQLGLPPSSPKLAFEAGEEGLDDPEASYSDDGNEDDVKKKYKMVRESSEVICPPNKLKFRRGKVVEINSGNNGGLRKLKFKQGRVMGDNSRNGRDGGGKRRFKKVEDGGGTNPETKTETVTLRRQDGQDNNKKDAQGLLNDVIELTATKLAESRNSKVKALVGAFETVISLQETKPASSSATVATPPRPSSSSSSQV